MEIFKESGFLHSEPLRVGTFEQCLDFEVESFSTTIPSKLGLPPPINPEDGSLIPNIAEGVVLRTLCGRNHCVKLKSRAFLEVIQCGNDDQRAQRVQKLRKTGGDLDMEQLRKEGVASFGLKEELMELGGTR